MLVCLQRLLKEPWVSALLAEESHADVKSGEVKSGLGLYGFKVKSFS